MSVYRFEISSTWNAEPLLASESGIVSLRIDEAVEIEVEGTFYGDPAPPGPPGPLPGLWSYEVIELFLLGEDEQYLEVELGPHGHSLGLCLHGRRQILEQGFPFEYHASIQGPLWRGSARIPLERLPPGLHAANAYAIHGEGDARRFLACHAVPGSEPDFHRLEHFIPLRRAQSVR